MGKRRLKRRRRIAATPKLVKREREGVESGEVVEDRRKRTWAAVRDRREKAEKQKTAVLKVEHLRVNYVFLLPITSASTP
ncbi:MAG: hypothetical protein ACKFI0_00560 [Candidatus Hodgkinia cicadicola]